MLWLVAMHFPPLFLSFGAVPALSNAATVPVAMLVCLEL